MNNKKNYIEDVIENHKKNKCEINFWNYASLYRVLYSKKDDIVWHFRGGELYYITIKGERIEISDVLNKLGEMACVAKDGDEWVRNLVEFEDLGFNFEKYTRLFSSILTLVEAKKGANNE